MKDEADSDLETRSHKSSPTPDPHEEAKGSRSKRKRKQKSADRCNSPKHYGVSYTPGDISRLISVGGHLREGAKYYYS